MFILLVCEDGSNRVRKKSAVKDVKLNTIGSGIRVSFTGKDNTPLTVTGTVKEFYEKYLM